MLRLHYPYTVSTTCTQSPLFIHRLHCPYTVSITYTLCAMTMGYLSLQVILECYPRLGESIKYSAVFVLPESLYVVLDCAEMKMVEG